jgi:hypothetical protein
MKVFILLKSMFVVFTNIANTKHQMWQKYTVKNKDDFKNV